MINEWLSNGAIMHLGEGCYAISWGKRTWLQSPAVSAELSYYFPDFFLTVSHPWFVHEFTKIVTGNDLAEYLSVSRTIGLYDWSKPSKQNFKSVFENLQAAFANESLKKAVPYVVEVARGSFTEAQLVCSLNSALAYVENYPAHVYGYWGAGEGILGVTPEVLLRSDNSKQISTMACAGTRPASSNKEDFIFDVKENIEHQYVVDAIVDSLALLGNVIVDKKCVVQHGKLLHLVTPILLKQTEATFEAIVKKLHPTPALGAYPKKVGDKWLEQYNLIVPRGRFGAPAGFHFNESHGGGFGCYVAIRNAQWNEDEIKLMAGCGVVRESVFENEWNEIELKLRSIKEMLNL